MNFSNLFGTDWFHKALKAVSYNRYTVLALMVAGATVALSGCAITGKDPISGRMATKEELAASLKAHAAEREAQLAKMKSDYEFQIQTASSGDILLVAQFQAAMDGITRQEQFWQSAVSWLGQIPAVSTNPLLGGALGLAGALFGGGVLADNRRKDALLKAA